MTKNVFKLMCLLVVFMFTGCAAPQAKLRYVWPPLPDDPKIEFIGVYNNDSDIDSNNVVDKIVGRDVRYALKNPQMAAGDGKGRVYVTDIKLGAVLVFDFNSKNISLLGGEGGFGLFGQPTGVALDADGYIYVADSSKVKIMIFTADGKPYGNIDLSARLKSIGFIAIDRQRKKIIVPDPKDSKVHVVDMKGTIINTFGNPESKEGRFNRPNAVAVAPDGNIVVADSLNARVALFNSDGTYLSSFGTRGDNPGQFNIIQGIAVDSVGHIYITDARSNRFSVMSSKGELLIAIGVAGDSKVNIGAFQIPFGISIDQNDAIYIVEKYYSRFQKYQFLTSDYLAKNPIKTDVLARPVKEENKGTK